MDRLDIECKERQESRKTFKSLACTMDDVSAP